MAKVKLNELKKTAKELNELLQPEEPINVKLPEEELIEAIKEGIEELEDGEADELTEVAQKVIKVLSAEDEEEEEKPVPKKKKGPVVIETEEEDDDDDEEEEEEEKPAPKKKKGKKEKPAPKKEEVEEEDDDDDDEINDIDDIDELKTLIKSDERFIGIRKGLALQKNLEKLKIRAIDALDTEAPEKVAKPKKEKKEKKEKTRSSGDMVYEETVKNPKITMKELMGMNEDLARPASEMTIKKYNARAIMVIDLVKKHHDVKF